MMKVISRVIGFGFCGAGFLWDWRGWTRVSEVGGEATGVRLRATLADRKSEKKSTSSVRPEFSLGRTMA
jgi:hypothetical protein